MDFYTSAVGGFEGGIDASGMGGGGAWSPGTDEAPTEGELPAGEAPAEGGWTGAQGEPRDPEQAPPYSSDPFGYETVDQMPWTMQQQWNQVYGQTPGGEAVNPSQIRDIKDYAETLQARFKEYVTPDKNITPEERSRLSGLVARRYGLDGTRFTNSAYAEQYNKLLSEKMRDIGLVDSDFPRKTTEVRDDEGFLRRESTSTAGEHYARWFS
jgi:hypothetical protein